MASIANILCYAAIACFALGLLLNSKYLFSLWSSIPRRARWPVVAWFIMLIGLGQWFSRSSSVSGLSSVDTTAYLQIASILISAFIMLLVYRRSLRINNFRLPLLSLFIFGLAGFLTSPVSDVPTLSAFKAMSLIVAVLLAVMAVKPLQDAKTPRLLSDTIFVYFVFIAFLAVLGSVLMPEITHRFNKGVFGFMLEGWPSLNSNSLSYVAAVVFVISFRRMFCSQGLQRRYLYFGICAIGGVTLLLAQGRTSIISSFLAIIFMSVYIREMRSVIYVMFMCMTVVLSAALVTGSIGDWTDSIMLYMQRGVTVEEIGTLSGRTKAWDLSWKLFLESPITGYGFYAAGKTLVSPHNAYFTILLNGGLFGFIPWATGVLGGMFVILRHIINRYWNCRNAENNYYKEIIAVMIVQFMRTITGQDLTIHSYSMLVFLSALVYVIARENIQKSG